MIGNLQNEMYPKRIFPKEHIVKRGRISTSCFIIPGRWLRKQNGKLLSSDFTYIKELTDLYGEDTVNWIDEVICEMDKPNQRKLPIKARI